MPIVIRHHSMTSDELLLLSGGLSAALESEASVGEPPQSIIPIVTILRSAMGSIYDLVFS